MLVGLLACFAAGADKLPSLCRLQAGAVATVVLEVAQRALAQRVAMVSEAADGAGVVCGVVQDA